MSAPLRNYTVLLRAAGFTVSGADVVFTAAEMIRTATDDEVKVITEFVIRMLGLPADQPELVTQVLRDLAPFPET